MDPLIKKKVTTEKLMKWRIFILLQKFIDFNQMVVLEEIKMTEKTSIIELQKTLELAKPQKENPLMVKYPLFLQVKFGTNDPEPWIDKELDAKTGFNLDTNLIQKVQIAKQFNRFQNIVQERIHTYTDESKKHIAETMALHDIDRNLQDLNQLTTVYYVNNFKLFEFMSNESEYIRTNVIAP